MRAWPPLMLASAIVAFAACGTRDSLDLRPPGSTATPTPSGPPTGTATPTPTPVSTPFAAGNGQDGALVVTTPTNVNTCHVVTLGTGMTLSVDSTVGFTSGDAVLVVQMQEDLAAPSGGMGAVGNTGVWEFARLGTVGAADATLLAALANGYHSGGNAHAEVCSVPEYTDLTVSTGALTAAPWDGATGGVIAVLVNGTLTLDGSIDATGAGFRGGVTPSNSNSPHLTAVDVTRANGGGGKGESIDGRAFGMGGRGNIGNGGGGGNPYVAGGAGGGNGGVGGTGGLEFKDVAGNPDPNTGGIAGTALAASARLWLGGGGGAGGVNIQQNSSGGSGGGAVLLVVHTLAGAGSIVADGEPGTTAGTDKVAGGGGGGGGSVLVIADLPGGFTGLVSVAGGEGGSCTADGAGPGGGGGGGRLYAPAAFTGATIVRIGGTNGIGGGNGARGATPGAIGILEP